MLYLQPLHQTLAALQPAMAVAQHPWWILGSTAVLLHGADPGQVRDLDVLLDTRDFGAVMARLGQAPQAGRDDQLFQSTFFNQWTGSVLPVELFAGFASREEQAWRPCQPDTRAEIDYFGVQTFVPARAELVSILNRFGRSKDLTRAALLSAGAQSPSRSESA